MQPIQFESVKSGDVTQNLKQSLQTAEGLAAIDKANRVNQTFAQDYQPNPWKDLAKWSPKVGDFLYDEAKKNEKRKKAELHLLHLQTKGSLLQAKREVLKNTKAGMKLDHEAVMAQLQQDETLPEDIKSRLKRLTKWDALQLDELALQDTVAEFNPSNDVQLQSSQTREEYFAIESAMVQKFMEQFGDVDEAMVYENVTAKLLEKQAASLQKWEQSIAKQEKERTKGNAKDAATASFKNNEPISNQTVAEGEQPVTGTTYSDFYTSTIGVYGSRKKVREEFFNHMKSLVTRGGGDDDAIEALGEEIWEGKPLKDNPLFWYIIDDLDKLQMEYDNKTEKVITENTKVEAKRVENDTYKEIVEDGRDPFEGNFIADRIKKIRDLGGDPSRLLRLEYELKEYDGKTYRNWEAEILEEAKAGTLTTRRLENTYPLLVRNGSAPKGSPFGTKSWKTIAADQTNVDKDLKKALGYLEKDIRADIRPLTDIVGKGGEDELWDQMKERVRHLVTEYRILGVEDPIGKAIEKVENWYENQKQTAKVDGKKVNFLGDGDEGIRFDSIGPGGIAPDSSEHNNKMIQLDNQYVILRAHIGGDDSGAVLTYKLFKPDGTPADHTPWFRRKELETLRDDIGKPNWRPDARVQYLMDKTGRSYSTVINEQLKTLDRKELPPSKALDMFHELPESAQSLFNQSKTEEEDQRALGSIDNFSTYLTDTTDSDIKWNSSITWGGLSDQVMNASELKKTAPHAIAAMMDMLVKYPKLTIDTSKNPPELSSPNISQPELYVEDMRERYKHSGGTDLFALKETQRF
tara:strand:- start:2115 stop:4526 length:2412 start_codon:yes stop_codon:yes gene_type:complete